MRVALFLFSLILLCPLLLNAQSNYKPGFVVTLEGDTLRGFINYREWANTPTSILFRVDAKSRIDKEYNITNTSYFEITGMDAYQRYEGPITMNPVAHEELTFSEGNLDSVTQVQNVVIFLRVNYKGDMLSLLSYTDQIKTRFFYQQHNGSIPQELQCKVFYGLRQAGMLRRSYGYTGPQVYLITQKGYIGQLAYLANKYNVATKKVTSEIESAHYSDYDLENVFSRMNEMRVSGSDSKFRRKNSIRYFAGVGLNSSNIRIRGIRGLDDPEQNPISYLPLVAFGFDAFLNKHIQRYYFRVEGIVTAAAYHVKDEREYEMEHQQQSYKISQQSLSLRPQLIYTLYNKDNFKFYAGAMAQINLSHYSENKYKTTSTFSYKYSSNAPESKSSEYTDYLGLMPFWLSYGFRAGAIVNKQFECYATYLPHAAVTQHRTSSIEFSSVQFGVNYLFKK